LAFAPAAHARDFFSSFLGGLFGGGAPAQPPSVPLPFAVEGGDPGVQQPRIIRSGGAAYCVRTCDGRYFPINATGGQSRAEICRSFCPASETKVVYGGNIDYATTENGKPYAELPNAFRYRTELVAGCTCNGKDPGGLAKMNIEDDPTIRKGDLVASPGGLVVANSSSGDRGGASVNYTPLPKTARSRFDRLPIVAAQ
jgi:hypothetical protein